MLDNKQILISLRFIKALFIVESYVGEDIGLNTSMLETNDFEIRGAFHKKKLSSYHKNSKTLVIDELGIDHGKNRIDIAVLNGHIHGYEIKSSRDNLNRLEKHLDSYGRCFQKITIITSPNHLDQVLEVSQQYLGVVCVRKGKRGGISFSAIRKAEINPNVEFFSLAHLLWRSETINLLSSFDVDNKILNGTRVEMYKKLSDFITVPELVTYIKKVFSNRIDWRSDLQHM